MQSLKLLSVFGTILLCTSAQATPCVSIAFDELKDMTIEELSREFCLAKKNANDNRAEAIDKILSKSASDPSGAQVLSADADRCDGEVKRILRVIGKKIQDPGDLEKVERSGFCSERK